MTQTLKSMFSLIGGVYAFGVLGFFAARFVFADRFRYLGLLADFTPFFFVPLIVLFPVAIVVRTKRLLIVLLPVMLLAGWLVGRHYVPRSLPESSSRSFTILNFNIYKSNPSHERAFDYIQTQNANLVLIQEVPTAYMLQGFEQLREQYPYQWTPDAYDEAILSKTPIIADPTWISDNPDWYGRVIVEIAGRRFALYNVHTPIPVRGAQNGIIGLMRGYNAAWRDAVIVGLMTQIEAETLPYIVTGDFNMTEYATIYPRLAARMTDSYREAGIGLGFTWSLLPIGGVRLPSVRIDYIWHSADFRTIRAARDLLDSGSDHAPLWATLEWR